MCPPDATDRAGREHDLLGVGGPAPVRERGVAVRPFPASRRLVTAAVRAGRRIMPMHGLFEVDITAARSLLAEHDPPLSLTAFVIASLGRAAAAHPHVHAYRDWRGRLVEHRHVDVQTLIEVPTDQGPFGMVHVVRDADVRSVAEISAELRAVKADPATTTTGRLLTTVAPTLGRIPGLYRAMYAAMSRSRRVHLATGTVQVTAVGMFADGAGFAIAPPNPGVPRRRCRRTRQTSPRGRGPHRSARRPGPHRHHRPQHRRRRARHPVRSRPPTAHAHRCRTGTRTHPNARRGRAGTQAPLTWCTSTDTVQTPTDERAHCRMAFAE